MAEPKADHDPTMEEILQSIKRIIAEDDGADTGAAASDASAWDEGDDSPIVDAPAPEPVPEPVKAAPAPKPAAEPAKTEPAKKSPPAKAAEEQTIDDILGSVVPEPEPAPEEEEEDVLELTEVVEDDAGDHQDILDDIDALTRAMESGAQADAADTEWTPVDDEEDLLEVVESEPEDSAPLKKIWSDRMAQEEPEAQDDDWLTDEAAELPVEEERGESILSRATASAAGAAIEHFMQSVQPRGGLRAAPVDSSLITRTGTTVEDLLVEALKPLLKQWLDEQLPDMVERVVREELQKLIPR